MRKNRLNNRGNQDTYMRYYMYYIIRLMVLNRAEIFQTDRGEHIGEVV